jgi:protein-disulfide isomerase
MKNPNTKILLIAFLAAIIVAGGAFFALKGSKTEVVAENTAVEQTADATAPASSSANVDYSSASLPTDPLGVRTLGNPDAPVKIEEFASLTCGHCAHFHGSTFQELKTKYIDTGKVFFTFTDFPLNAPALDAAMVARCMAPERYFSFLSFLMETQEQWAFSADYKTALNQNAKLAGMNDEAFDSCLANTALKDGLVDRMKAKAEQHQLSSTPSFVITGAAGTSTLTGALPIVSFDKAIEDAQNTEAAAPAATEETAPVAVEETAPAVVEDAPATEAPVTEEAPEPESTEAETTETAPEQTTAPTAEEENATETVQP